MINESIMQTISFDSNPKFLRNPKSNWFEAFYTVLGLIFPKSRQLEFSEKTSLGANINAKDHENLFKPSSRKNINKLSTNEPILLRRP